MMGQEDESSPTWKTLHCNLTPQRNAFTYCTFQLALISEALEFLTWRMTCGTDSMMYCTKNLVKL
jgi:hypothetical protein